MPGIGLMVNLEGINTAHLAVFSMFVTHPSVHANLRSRDFLRI